MEDFEIYTPEVMEKLAGHSSVIWTLGISSLLVSKEEYRKLTLDYAVSLRPFLFSVCISLAYTSASLLTSSGCSSNRLRSSLPRLQVRFHLRQLRTSLPLPFLSPLKPILTLSKSSSPSSQTSYWNPSLGMRIKAATETKIASILGASRSFFFRPAFIYPPTRLPGLRPRASAEITADKWATTLEKWAGPSMM